MASLKILERRRDSLRGWQGTLAQRGSWEDLKASLTFLRGGTKSFGIVKDSLGQRGSRERLLTRMKILRGR